MTKILKPAVTQPTNMFQAMVEVDADVNAERLMVIDRLSGTTIQNSKVATSNATQLRVPLTYATSNRLLVGIVDDDGQYNCKFVDGIQAQLVDGNLVRMQR